MVRCTGKPSGTSVIAMSRGPLRSIGALVWSRVAKPGWLRIRWVKVGQPTMPVACSRSTSSRAVPASSRGSNQQRHRFVQGTRGGEQTTDPEERHRAQDPGIAAHPP